MTQDQQFWWNWYVQVAVASATFAAVVMALIGDWLRARIFPPRLEMRLRSAEGEPCPVTLFTRDEFGRMILSRTVDGRYYHLQVSNGRKYRWPGATDPRVHLLLLEEVGKDGRYHGIWSGSMPLRWRHEDTIPPIKKIGPSWDCDLCSVNKEKWMEIYPVVAANNLKARWTEATQLRLQLQAKSVEADSKVLTLEISWDGTWVDGAKEMADHLSISDVTPKNNERTYGIPRDAIRKPG